MSLLALFRGPNTFKALVWQTGCVSLTCCRVLSVSLPNSGLVCLLWNEDSNSCLTGVLWGSKQTVWTEPLCALYWMKYPYPRSGLSEEGESLLYTAPEGGRQRGQTEEPRRCRANPGWAFLRFAPNLPTCESPMPAQVLQMATDHIRACLWWFLCPSFRLPDPALLPRSLQIGT